MEHLRGRAGRRAEPKEAAVHPDLDRLDETSGEQPKRVRREKDSHPSLP
jgi:hypothetical protein